MWVGLLTDKINNKLEKSDWINEHALNREPVLLNTLNSSAIKSGPLAFIEAQYEVGISVRRFPYPFINATFNYYRDRNFLEVRKFSKVTLIIRRIRFLAGDAIHFFWFEDITISYILWTMFIG